MNEGDEAWTYGLDRSIEGEDVVEVVVVVSDSGDRSKGENDVLGSRDVGHGAVPLHQVPRIALEEADTVAVGLADLRTVEGGVEEAERKSRRRKRGPDVRGDLRRAAVVNLDSEPKTYVEYVGQSKPLINSKANGPNP